MCSTQHFAQDLLDAICRWRRNMNMRLHAPAHSWINQISAVGSVDDTVEPFSSVDAIQLRQKLSFR
jgi:hypothetical protein